MPNTIAKLLIPVALLAIPTAAQAQGLDLSGMHEQRVEGGRVCMTDHFHDGSSSGGRSRRAAEAEAMRAWADFTIFEYGTAWGNPRTAASREMKCSQSGSGWACDFQARPCRQGGAARSGKRPRKR